MQRRHRAASMIAAKTDWHQGPAQIKDYSSSDLFGVMPPINDRVFPKSQCRVPGAHLIGHPDWVVNRRRKIAL